ncbi:hypothetical protein D1J51_05975 [Leucobacter sp. wl10]|nr:hypothetical protein D1J51_05975 [Leucobacter sp. wl10]
MVLTFIVVILLALGGGFLGAKLSGGGGGGDDASAQGSWLQEIKDRGVLRVGVAISPPHTVELEDGTFGGPNLIPLQNLADALNVKLETVPAEWKNIVAGLQAGRYDFAANLDRTLERATAVQFTNPVWDYPAAMAVMADAPYTTVDDVVTSGNPISIVTGSAASGGFPRKFPEANYQESDAYTSSLQTLLAGRVVAITGDLPTLVSFAQENSDVKIILPDPDVYRGFAAYGVPATADARSVETVNIAIERAINDGLMDEAYAKVGYVTEDQLGEAGLLKQ